VLIAPSLNKGRYIMMGLGPAGAGYALAARLNVSLPGVDHEVADRLLGSRAPGLSVFPSHTWQYRSCN
jgi:hypothetical protein